MKLVVPITSAGDVAALVNAGADEFYCGVYDERYMDGAGFSIWNKRPSIRMNLNSMEELDTAVMSAHRAGRNIFLTLNSLYYIEEHYESLEKTILRTNETGIDGYIVSDPGIINLIHALGIKTRIHVSTTATVYNSRAVQFYKRMGVERIIFPRHMSPVEMAALSSLDKNMEYEAFMLNSRCPNEDGLCTVEHSSNFFYDVSGCFFSGRFMDMDASGEGDRYVKVCSFISDACGACIIPGLLKSGIRYLKIVGRENSIRKRVKDTIFLKRIIRECLSGEDGIRGRLMKVYENTYGVACFSRKCYYPVMETAVPGLAEADG